MKQFCWRSSEVIKQAMLWICRSVFKKSFILLFLEEYVDKLLIIDYFRVTAYTEIFKACTFGSANEPLIGLYKLGLKTKT